jgi:hypothetical protein
MIDIKDKIIIGTVIAIYSVMLINGALDCDPKMVTILNRIE